MTAVEAIETLAQDRGDRRRDRVHALLLKALHEGQSLSRAMRATQAFPQILIAGVTASERTSTLVAALDDYLRYEGMVERLKRQIVSAAIYPALVVGLGVLISCFLLVFVIPRFASMYGDAPGAVSPATQAVLVLSRVLRDHMPLVLSGSAVAALALLHAWRSGLLLRMAGKAIESNTFLRRQSDHFKLAKLYQSLGMMFKGGYALDEALLVCEGLELGTRITHALGRARDDIAMGKSVSQALSRAQLTEAVTERLLAVGERIGGFDGVLQTIADRHASAFTTFVQRATRIVEPLLLLMVALVVGAIVVMMYMPIFDIASGVRSLR